MLVLVAVLGPVVPPESHDGFPCRPATDGEELAVLDLESDDVSGFINRAYAYSNGSCHWIVGEFETTTVARCEAHCSS